MKNVGRYVRAFACLLLCVLWLCACAPEGRKEVLAVGAEQKRVYVALGDSICSGYRLRDPQRERYSSLIGNALDYTVYNYGTDGMTGKQLLAFLRDGKAEHLAEAELVTVSIGGNNVLGAAFPAIRALLSVGGTSQPMDRVYGAIEKGIFSFAEELPAILSEIRRVSPHATVIVQTVYNPYCAFDHFRMQVGEETLSLASFVDGCVSRLNAQIFAMADTEGFLVCDVYGAFAQAHENGEARLVNASAVGLVFDPHPNAEGHRVMARAYLELLAKQQAG